MSTQTQSLTVFNFKSHQLRTITKNNEPWFMAKDVADTLELKNSRHIIATLDPDEKEKVSIFRCTSDVHLNGNGNHRPVWFISESGVYQCLVRSDKPQAKEFQRWLRKEVLPAIRKTGEFKPAKKAEQPEQDKIIKQYIHEITVLKTILPPTMLSYSIIIEFFNEFAGFLENLDSIVSAKNAGNPTAILVYNKILKELDSKRFLKQAAKI